MNEEVSVVDLVKNLVDENESLNELRGKNMRRLTGLWRFGHRPECPLFKYGMYGDYDQFIKALDFYIDTQTKV